MRIELIIPGDPIAQPRAKATAFNGHARMYTPAGKVQDYKATIRLAAEAAWKEAGAAPFTGPLRIDCEWVFARPKGHYGTGKNAAALKPKAPHWHTAKPDRDNVDKAVLDALKGFICDDRQVCVGDLRKRYAMIGETPRTIICIEELEA